MPGFILYIAKEIDALKVSDASESNLLTGKIAGSNFKLLRKTIKKFENDKLFLESNDFVIILDGVILNKADLMKKSIVGWEETIIQLYKKNGEHFIADLNGSFSGALYDKSLSKWIIFTDHIGSKHVYFSKRKDAFIFASDIKDIYHFFIENNQRTSLDVQACYALLSCGFMLDDITLSKDIKKLIAGTYVVIEDWNTRIEKYYQLNNSPNNSLSENDCIEQMDVLFRKSIQQQFDKDIEYDYKHLVALSGRLDSRMTSWVANDMGYKKQLNFTFSQSHYLDQTIPQRIAADLKHEWLFKALDNGIFLYDLEKITEITGSIVLYYGVGHTNSVLKYLDFQSLGLLHSGQLGGLIFSANGEDIPSKKQQYESIAFSTRYLHKIENFKQLKNYENQEITLFMQRGFNGINSGNLSVQQYTETMSPFYNVEVLNYMLRIPPKLRNNYNLYKKWMKLNYPESVQYPWEKIKTKVTSPYISLNGKLIYLSQVPEKILKKIKPLKYSRHPLSKKKNMNPLDYWYNSNKGLKKYLDSYVAKNIDFIDVNKKLKQDVDDLYRIGNGFEKNMVLSLLSAIKLFNIKC